MLIVVIDFWRLCPEAVARIFNEPGDHAGEMETSLLLHICPELVAMRQAGPGGANAWQLASLRQAGVWTPRPWSHVHPDTGSGDPAAASATKGQEFFEVITAAVADVIVELSHARKGMLPYV